MEFKGDGGKGVFLFHETNQTIQGKHNILKIFLKYSSFKITSWKQPLDNHLCFSGF